MINSVNKTEGHIEIMERFQNVRKDGQIVRPTDRHGVTNFVYEN
jgi:hypothetical protein